jgi:amino acid transporter, AAT family
VVILNSILVLVQGWSSFSPRFSAIDFVSFYVELPIMLFLYLGWKFWKKTDLVTLEEMDLETDVYEVPSEEAVEGDRPGWKGRVQTAIRWIF